MERSTPQVRTVSCIRYVTPLREGGSLPAIVEADDLGTYVLKFRGAGQGPRVLVAELLAGEIARFLGLPVPEIVFMEVDLSLGRSEPDPEIQALIQASAGLNLALDYLPGSIGFDPAVGPLPDSALASAIVWFDALTTNVDRTVRNTNMLLWHRKLYLIDHGAALYFHHTWIDFMNRSRNGFPQIADHVLLPLADTLDKADALLASELDAEIVRGIVALLPDVWLNEITEFANPQAVREAYTAYFLRRLEVPRLFVEEAIHARSRIF